MDRVILSGEKWTGTYCDRDKLDRGHFVTGIKLDRGHVEIGINWTGDILRQG